MRKVWLEEKNTDFLSIDSLHFAYDQQPVLNGLKLKMKRAERLGIVGASGSGKSTLLKVLDGTLVQSEGRIALNQVDYSLERNDRINKHPKVALMAQDFDLNPSLTADENIEWKGRHLSPTALKRYLGRVHRAFHLQKVKEQKVRELSGGQKQRVALACALISDVELLLLDEPFSQLDYYLKQELLQFLESESANRSIIMVGHEPTDLMRYCDRIAVLDKGRVLQVGSVDEVYHRPRNLKVARLTGMVNYLSKEEQEACKIEESLFRPLHCRLKKSKGKEAWELVRLEYHAFGQLGLLKHQSGVKLRAQIPLDGEFQVGTFWDLSIKKP
ncbi:ABC transporter ATP-binding protein [Croceimicrobium sp.]|uniref:ABC transporter ATP-binding protein n=1 Tax=Croceimicrobium sp. TaxID=2828340 RepID=UPI003BACEE8E